MTEHQFWSTDFSIYQTVPHFEEAVRRAIQEGSLQVVDHDGRIAVMGNFDRVGEIQFEIMKEKEGEDAE